MNKLIFPNAHFTLYLNSSESSTLNFPPPPLLLTSNLWLERVYADQALPVWELQKQDVFYLTAVNAVVRGHFHLRHFFFFPSWFSNVFCLLNDSKNQMHSSHHFCLSICRQFIGSPLLNLAVSHSSKYIPVCFISFLRFQPYIPPVWGKTLGASQ